MTHCPVCGGDDYEEVDGLYFCVVCNTQSQTLRKEESADASCMRGLKLKTASGYQESDKRVAAGDIIFAPQDVLHILLRHQADALIEKGISKEIKVVIRRIWEMYLASTLEQNSGFGDLDLVINEPRRRKTKKKQSERSRPSDEETELAEENDAGLDENEHDSDSDQSDGSTNENNYGITYQSALRLITRVRLSLAVSICHVALQFVNNLVTASDLYCWMMNGSLPYRNAEDLMPQYMRFQMTDRTRFTSSAIPKPSTIIQISSKLIRFLELDAFPSVDLRPLAVKLIWKLHLPGELHGMVQRLLYSRGQEYFSVDGTTGILTLHPVELMVMSYIMVVLKMLFALNDTTEWKISNYAKSVNRAVTGLKLFIMEDWMSWMTRDVDVNKIELPFNPKEALKFSDSKLLEKHPGLRHNSSDLKRAKKDLFLSKETRDLLERTIRPVGEKFPTKRPITDSFTTENQAKSSLLRPTNTLDTDSYDLVPDIRLDSDALGEDASFRNTSIAFLTNTDAFEQYVSEVRRRPGSMCGDIEDIPKMELIQTALNYKIAELCCEHNSKSYQKCLEIAAKLIHFTPQEINSWVFRLEHVLFRKQLLLLDRKTFRSQKRFPGFLPHTEL